jgi:hypothetical protein
MDATMKIEEQRPVHGHITDDPRDDPNLLSQSDPHGAESDEAILDNLGHSFVPYGSERSSSFWSLFFGNGTSSQRKQANDIVADVFPTPKVRKINLASPY